MSNKINKIYSQSYHSFLHDIYSISFCLETKINSFIKHNIIIFKKHGFHIQCIYVNKNPDENLGIIILEAFYNIWILFN